MVSYWQYIHSLRFVASPFLDDGGKLVLHNVYYVVSVYMISVLLPPPSLHLFACAEPNYIVLHLLDKLSHYLL